MKKIFGNFRPTMPTLTHMPVLGGLFVLCVVGLRWVWELFYD